MTLQDFLGGYDPTPEQQKAMTTPRNDDKKNFLLWMDLETTGLDEQTGKILEVAVILTNDNLKELQRKSWVIGHERNETLFLMNDYVLKMHMDSGLLAEVWKSTTTMGQVSNGIHQMLRNVGCTGPKRANVYLAGSSIHFDRRWIEDKTPSALLDLLHYRMVDVSVYKTMFPGLLDQGEGPVAHRAMRDVEYSLDQQRQMTEIIDDYRKANGPVDMRNYPNVSVNSPAIDTDTGKYVPSKDEETEDEFLASLAEQAFGKDLNMVPPENRGPGVDTCVPEGKDESMTFEPPKTIAPGFRGVVPPTPSEPDDYCDTSRQSKR